VTVMCLSLLLAFCSDWAAREFAHLRRLPVLCSPSYFLSTAGNVCSETIERSMQQQSEH
jgi:putative transposase